MLGGWSLDWDQMIYIDICIDQLFDVNKNQELFQEADNKRCSDIACQLNSMNWVNIQIS